MLINLELFGAFDGQHLEMFRVQEEVVLELKQMEQ
jgi:hypothetical protein